MGWTFAFKDPHESAADFLKRECLTWRLPPRECPEIVASATGANCIAFAVRFPAAYLALDPERKHFFIPDEDGSITTAILYLIKNERLFGYKDLSEIAGPNDPVEASILRTLSAVDMEGGGDSAKWAKTWRDRCSAYTNSLHSALALLNCGPNNGEPDWTKFASLEITPCRRERRGERDTWTINVVDDAEVTFWTIYGRRKADQDGFEECEPITDCATRDHAQKIARLLQERSGLSISTKLLIGNPAAPLRESTMAAPVWVATVPRRLRKRRRQTLRVRPLRPRRRAQTRSRLRRRGHRHCRRPHG